MDSAVRRRIREHVEKMNSIPTVPAIIRPLLHYLSKPIEQLEIRRIVDMVSCDESITAQCLRVANSALYYRPRTVKTVHGAVVALGVRQLCNILLGCSLLHLLPKESWLIDPVVFWEHSLGCALVNRYLSRKLGHGDPEKAYLAGLLHDLGVLVGMIALPQEFRSALEKAMREQTSLYDAEKATLDFTHCDTGEIIAQYWKLPEDVDETIKFHHDVQQAKLYPQLVAMVGLSDLACRAHGLGCGYSEQGLGNILDDPAWAILGQARRQPPRFNAASFTLQLERFAKEAQTVVASVFRT